MSAFTILHSLSPSLALSLVLRHTLVSYSEAWRKRREDNIALHNVNSSIPQHFRLSVMLGNAKAYNVGHLIQGDAASAVTGGTQREVVTDHSVCLLLTPPQRKQQSSHQHQILT